MEHDEFLQVIRSPFHFATCDAVLRGCKIVDISKPLQWRRLSKKVRSHPLAPSAKRLRPQAVGERTVRLPEIFRAMARFSPSAPSGHLPRRGRFFDTLSLPPRGGRWPAGPDEGKPTGSNPLTGDCGNSALISQRSGPLTASPEGEAALHGRGGFHIRPGRRWCRPLQQC